MCDMSGNSDGMLFSHVRFWYFHSKIIVVSNFSIFCAFNKNVKLMMQVDLSGGRSRSEKAKN